MHVYVKALKHFNCYGYVHFKCIQSVTFFSLFSHACCIFTNQLQNIYMLSQTDLHRLVNTLIDKNCLILLKSWHDSYLSCQFLAINCVKIDKSFVIFCNILDKILARYCNCIKESYLTAARPTVRALTGNPISLRRIEPRYDFTKVSRMGAHITHIQSISSPDDCSRPGTMRQVQLYSKCLFCRKSTRNIS